MHKKSHIKSNKETHWNAEVHLRKLVLESFAVNVIFLSVAEKY